MTTHTTRFYRDPSSGEHVAQCSCGWRLAGELAELQGRAASHDLDDLPQVKAPTVVPFRSGLPEDWR